MTKTTKANRGNFAPTTIEVIVTNSSASSPSLRSDPNRFEIHALALEILRQGSSLMTMIEAVERARAVLRKAVG